MKRNKFEICQHDWEDLYEFRTVDGGKYLQQRCTKCKESRYLELEKPPLLKLIKMTENNN